MKLAPEDGRIRALDGVRGLAIVVVVVHNAAWISGNSGQLTTKLFTSLAAAGWAGVELFFVLSGFLITGILRDTRTNPDFFRRFYYRRSLRIFPLYFLLLGVVALVVAPLQRGSLWSESVRAHQWTYWLYLSNWTEPFGRSIRGLSHLWSLAVEEQFYLLWPFAVWCFGAKGLLRLSAALAMSGPALRYAMYVGNLPHYALYTFTVARWDALAFGASVALILRDVGLEEPLRRWLWFIWLCAGIAALSLAFHLHGFHSFNVMVLIIGQSFAALLSACLIAQIAMRRNNEPKSQTIKFFETPMLQSLGKHSYAMYLIHVPIHIFLLPSFLSWVEHPDDFWHLPRLLFYISLVTGISYVLARALWRFIEHPFLRRRDS